MNVSIAGCLLPAHWTVAACASCGRCIFATARAACHVLRSTDGLPRGVSRTSYSSTNGRRDGRSDLTLDQSVAAVSFVGLAALAWWWTTKVEPGCCCCCGGGGGVWRSRVALCLLAVSVLRCRPTDFVDAACLRACRLPYVCCRCCCCCRGSASGSPFRPEIGRDYPLNLSILISGGKETNQDSLSNGE